MEIGNFTAFGENLVINSPHWLNIYGRLLILLADLDMATTVDLIKHPIYEDENGYDAYIEGMSDVAYFLEGKNLFIEGYTAKVVCPWFLDFCKEWHKDNTEVKVKANLKKIEELKAEIKNLESK